MAFTKFLLLLVTLTYVSAFPQPVVNFNVDNNLSNVNYSNVNFEEVNIYIYNGKNGEYEIDNNFDVPNQINGSDGSEELQEANDHEEEEEAKNSEEAEEQEMVEGSDGSEILHGVNNQEEGEEAKISEESREAEESVEKEVEEEQEKPMIQVEPIGFSASSYWSLTYGPGKSKSTNGGYWYSGEDQTLPATIWFQFSPPQIIKKYSFSGKPSDDEVFPTDYIFFGSNADDCTDSSQWIILFEGKTEGPPADPTVDYVSNTDSYLCYGFKINKSWKSETYTSLSKLEFYAQPRTCDDIRCGRMAVCSKTDESCHCLPDYAYNGESLVPEGVDCTYHSFVPFGK